MAPELILTGALLIDLALGDPRWLPHPVSGIGWLARRAETLAGKTVASRRLAGALSAVVTLAVCVATAWGVLAAAGRLHPVAGDIVSMLMIYVCICPRDLADHADRVYSALKAGNIPRARQQVGMMVGRETKTLDESGIVRAAVESVAESIVDGATAPLFYAALFGPVGAVAYRAVNTMDAMFGYKDETYIDFGTAAARLDDIANFVPARLSAPIIGLVAVLFKRDAFNSWRVLRRDHSHHGSPNSGWTEAAMAGALGVQLGGDSTYAGRTIFKPTIGDADNPLEKRQIPKAVSLMMATVLVFAAGCIGLRQLVCILC